MVEIGKADVQKVLDLGPNAGFKLLEEWQSNHYLQGKYKSFNDFYYSH